MDPPSVDPVLERLNEWRAEAIERLRAGDDSALSLKLALEHSIRWLEICGRHGLPVPDEAVALPIPTDLAPLGEYRVLWDCESEDRESWREVARPFPGDMLVKIK